MQSRFGVQLWGRLLALRGASDFAPAWLTVGVTAAAVHPVGPSEAAVTAAPVLTGGSSVSGPSVRTNLSLLPGVLQGRGYATAAESCQASEAVSTHTGGGTSLPGHAAEHQARGAGSASASAREVSAQAQRQQRRRQWQRRERLQQEQRGGGKEERQVPVQSRARFDEQQAERRAVQEEKSRQRQLVGLLGQAGNYEEVAQLMSSGKESSVRTLTAALHAVGRLSGQKPGSEAAARAALAPLFAAATPLLGSFDSQGLANAAWAAGKCNYRLAAEEQQAFGAAMRAQALAGAFKPLEIPMCFYSFGRLSWVPAEDVAQLLVDAVLCSGHQLTGQQTANMLWGISRNRLDPTAARVPQLLEAVVPHLDTFDLYAITSCLFSLAVIRCGEVPACQAQLPAFVEALEPWLHAATARELSMLTWALGGLQLGRHVSDDLWSKLEAGLLLQPCLPPPAPSQLLTGAAWMQRRFSDGVLEMVLASAQEQVRRLQSSDIGALLWALGRMGLTVGDPHVTAELLQGLLRELLTQVAEGWHVLTRHVATSLWGLSLIKFPVDMAALDALTSFLDKQYSTGGIGIVTYDAMLLLTAYEYYHHGPGFQMLKRHIAVDHSGEAAAIADLEAALETEREAAMVQAESE